MPRWLQRLLLWVLDLLGVMVIVFVPFYLWRYGVRSVLTQSFGEGIVVEVIGAVGTAVLIIILDSFATRLGVRWQDDKIHQQSKDIEAIRHELNEARQEISEIKHLLEQQMRKRHPLLRLFFGE